MASIREPRLGRRSPCSDLWTPLAPRLSEGVPALSAEPTEAFLRAVSVEASISERSDGTWCIFGLAHNLCFLVGQDENLGLEIPFFTFMSLGI